MARKKAQVKKNAKPKPKKVVKATKKAKVEEPKTHEKFETTRRVSMRVNKVLYEGTHFEFPVAVVEDRKRILRGAYGEDIIK